MQRIIENSISRMKTPVVEARKAMAVMIQWNMMTCLRTWEESHLKDLKIQRQLSGNHLRKGNR